MDGKNAPQSVEEIIERIGRLSDEAEWSADELREVFTDAGIDPDRFVSEIKTKIKDLLKAPPERSDYDPLPLLARLRRITGMKATAIAEKIGATVTFLSDLSSHPNAIPPKARKELARRAANSLPGVTEWDALDAFESGLLQQAAAYRDSPFPDEEVDFEKIVRRSEMSDEEKRYWLSLSEESPE